ncbi:MAG: alpha/beta fold hydrolase [Planctomycetes bacterium]|nr:alpha/beta fold hydrolase [Planctomycetota bacterium]
MSLAPLAAALTLALLAGCRPEPATADERSLESDAQLASAPDRLLRSAGIELRYRELGSGTPVLLLHGYTDDLSMWGPVADDLARELRVVVPDLRGFGRSTKLRDPAQAGPREMAGDLVRLLDHLALPSAHFVGYSMGALVAAHLALEHPRRVESAVLVAGPFYPDVASARGELLPFVAAQERGEGLLPFLAWILPTWERAPLAALAAQLATANDPGALIAALRAIPEQPLDWSQAARSATPIVALVSLSDPLLAHSRRLVERWNGARLLELAEGDHADVFLAPAVRDELRALVRRRAAERG